MTDPLTLADLLRRKAEPTNEQMDNWREVEPVPATREDWIEVGKSLGGEVEEAYVLDGYIRVDAPSLGPYLVIPIGEAE